MVERAAAAEIEACVVPVAREDPVRNQAAVEREAHVWAAIVDSVDVVAGCEQTERVPVELNNQPFRRAQVGERRGTGGMCGLCDSHRVDLHQ